MKRTALIVLIAILILALNASAMAVEKVTDHADLSSYIADCAQFGSYQTMVEALLCAASIPYGKLPEACVAELQRKGFEFEYEIFCDYPQDYDVFNVDPDKPELPMMWIAVIHFSPTITLFLRTESEMVPLVSAADDVGMGSGANIWKPVRKPAPGGIMYAHLQFPDPDSQEWISWTFTSRDKFTRE